MYFGTFLSSLLSNSGEQVSSTDERIEARLATATDWSASVAWQPQLTFRASSYSPRRLFDVAPLRGAALRDATPEQLAIDPSGRWAYCEKTLRRGRSLATMYGKRNGTCMFDGDVLVPALHERERHDTWWKPEPWMSLTPMELITLRAGIRRAKGDVIVAGLGLGHQLIEVSRRKQVASVTLVELDAGLVDWIFPRLQPHLGMPVRVIVGDAFVELPRLAADVALVDVFPTWGGNGWARHKLRRSCRSIKHIWCWGAVA